ncbi:transposase [Opitutus sp. GAS368]|jgi:putative transposase|uniref:REP-associated tyrosine transposase n=1 Tax=Opitutus sp. GAS368 TaxID=1882749 RepID=UPI00087AE04B|nr:transposase [Opitutus sp. GAS368]SDR98936.1 putative DNA methylase/putative transposase [Opitutus sp. GAS368]
MLERDHLRRLKDVWIEPPIYFLTVCTAQRAKLLAHPPAAKILTQAWRSSPAIYQWVIGRYVIMPDHVHFFATPRPQARPLSDFMRDWKKWTTWRFNRGQLSPSALWQAEFFDHVLRSPKSYEEKWQYVRQNPVRAGLTASAEEWPYSGECEMLTM